MSVSRIGRVGPIHRLDADALPRGEHQPILGNALHPGADVGDKRAAGPETIIVVPQRTKGALG